MVVEPLFELKTVAKREDGCASVLLHHPEGFVPNAGRPFAATLERTFENLRTVITNGTYKCVRTYYIRAKYETFEIMVPGHSRVLFHRGNAELDSEGCILVAESFGQLNAKLAVLDSKGGFAEFWSLAKGEETFYLVVSGR